METTTRRSVAVAFVLVLTSIGVPAVVAQPARAVEHLVVMGAVDPDLPDPSPRSPTAPGRLDRFEYLAYYPTDLQVHRGDTVRFRRDGFHTVTFSPAGKARRGWVRRDEVEGVSAVRSTEPNPKCGHGALPPCVLDRTDGFLNSGWNDLELVVDLAEGAYTYYCTLHEGMQGTVQVVAETQPLRTAAELDAERREQVARDTAAAEALMAANQTPALKVVDDHVRWTVKVGDFTADDRVSIMRHMPANLKIAAGDEVVFQVPKSSEVPPGRVEAATDAHTVTFPHDAVGQTFGLARYFNPTCDADGPESGAPGVSGIAPAFVAGCPPGTSFELVLQPWAWQAPTRAPDNVVSTPLTVHDSGLLAPDGTSCRNRCDPWTGDRLPSQSTAVFPNAGTFSYVCLVHPEWGMAASITVR